MKSFNERSTLMFAIGAVVIASVLAGYYLESQSLSPLAPSTFTSTSAEAGTLLVAHLQKVGSRNITSLMGDYETNAVVTWTGEADGFAGNYAKVQNITSLFGTFLDRFSQLEISNITQFVKYKGENITTGGSFYMSGLISPALSGCQAGGHLNGEIDIEITFLHETDGTWLISKEIWNFLHPFNSGICA